MDKETETVINKLLSNKKVSDDLIDFLNKENELLQKEVKKHLTYQDHRHGRIGTHDPICYEYGPRHYECALREIDRLREALRVIGYGPPHEGNPLDLLNQFVDLARATLKEGK